MSADIYENSVSPMKEWKSRPLQDMSLYTQPPVKGSCEEEKFRALYAGCFPDCDKLSVDRLLDAGEQQQADLANVYSDGLFFGAMAGISHEKCAFVFFLALEEHSCSRGYAGRLLSAVRRLYPDKAIFIPSEKAALDNDCYTGLITPNKALFLRNGYVPYSPSLSFLNREYELLCTNGFGNTEQLYTLFKASAFQDLSPVALF